MREIDTTGQYRRDLAREATGQHGKTLKNDLKDVLKLLQNDTQLPRSYKDHQMQGEQKHLRNCHLHGDLVLLYCKIGKDTLQLVRLGSHSALGI